MNIQKIICENCTKKKSLICHWKVGCCWIHPSSLMKLLTFTNRFKSPGGSFFSHFTLSDMLAPGPKQETSEYVNLSLKKKRASYKHTLNSSYISCWEIFATLWFYCSQTSTLNINGLKKKQKVIIRIWTCLSKILTLDQQSLLTTSPQVWQHQTCMSCKKSLLNMI